MLGFTWFLADPVLDAFAAHPCCQHRDSDGSDLSDLGNSRRGAGAEPMDAQVKYDHDLHK